MKSLSRGGDRQMYRQDCLHLFVFQNLLLLDTKCFFSFYDQPTKLFKQFFFLREKNRKHQQWGQGGIVVENLDPHARGSRFDPLTSLVPWSGCWATPVPLDPCVFYGYLTMLGNSDCMAHQKSSINTEVATLGKIRPNEFEH